MSEATLYDRLGGASRIQTIADRIFDKHLANPVINQRYINSQRDEVIPKLVSFLVAGTGGPQQYTGQDMRTAHTGMNISEQEFMAVLDDIVEALQELEIGEREQQELLYANFMLRHDIVRV